MAIFGSISTVRAQAFPAAKFAATFEYLDEVFRAGSAIGERIRSVPAGETKRYELSGGAFALEQAYFTKPRAEGFFESHLKYIDVQVIFEGEEWMEVVGVDRAVVRQAYVAERDLIVYEDVTRTNLLHLPVGQTAVYYPVDVHMGGLFGPASRGLVRKTVIKVPVAG